MAEVLNQPSADAEAFKQRVLQVWMNACGDRVMQATKFIRYAVSGGINLIFTQVDGTTTDTINSIAEKVKGDNADLQMTTTTRMDTVCVGFIQKNAVSRPSRVPTVRERNNVARSHGGWSGAYAEAHTHPKERHTVTTFVVFCALLSAICVVLYWTVDKYTSLLF